MSSKDDDKGFKGLSGLGGKPRPRKPVPETPSTPVVPPPLPTRAPTPAQMAPASRQATPSSPTPQSPSAGSAAPQPNAPQGTSGCLTAALVIGALFVLLMVWGAVTQPDPSAPAPSEPAAAVAPSMTPAYVTAQLANVRASGDANAEVVAQLPQWTAISVLATGASWSQIRFHTPTGEREGYISNRLIAGGDPRAAYCEAGAGGEPHSGEVLAQSSTGSHSIKVTAGPTAALVKLRSNGTTALAFYVRAHETGTVANLADGTYQIMFATGEGFSRKCLEFMSSMNVLADPQPVTFMTTRETTYEGEVIRSSVASYTLTQVTGGNFAPKTVDPSAFRE